MIQAEKNLQAVFMIVTLLTATVFQATAQDSSERAERITPTVLAVAEVMPSVVNLSTEKITGIDEDDSWLEFQPEEVMMGPRYSYSLGSGCVIDSSGLILTNAHVVERAVKILVAFNDVEQYYAEVIAVDAVNDLAMLQLPGQQNGRFKPIKMGRPGDLLLGENVIAVGNPYGLGNSISSGILSAIGRRVSYRNRLIFNDVLQSDANIHPGNSGSPLINSNGEMIGINTSILKGTQGISFAIPLQRIENVLGRWLIPERFRDVSLGIIPGVEVKRDGTLVFYIQEVIPDSPAYRVGLREKMTIDLLDGEPVADLLELSRKLWRLEAGAKIRLVCDNRPYSLQAIALESVNWQRLAELKLGITLQELNQELAEMLQYPFQKGLLVSGFPGGGITGVSRGDVILQLGDISINTPEDFVRALRDYRYGQEIPAVLLQVVKNSNHANSTDADELVRKNVIFKVN